MGAISPPRPVPPREKERGHPQPASVIARLEAWSEEQNIDALESGLTCATSYAEAVVIMHRLRTLRRDDTMPLQLVGQRIGLYFLRDIAAHPGELRAIFLEDSLLADHLAYLWAARTREVAGYVCRVGFKPDKRIGYYSVPSALTPPAALKHEHRHMWIKSLYRLTHTRMVIKTDEATRQDVEAHIIAQGGLISKRASAAYLKRLSNYLWKNREETVRCTKKYRESEACTYHALADVAAEQEEGLIERLLEAGAKVRANKMSIPTYQSQHVLSPGKRFSLHLEEGGAVHYVPHYSMGTKQVQRYQHRLRVQLTPTDGARLKQKFRAAYSPFMIRKSEMLVATRAREEQFLLLDKLSTGERSRAQAAADKRAMCVLTYFTRGKASERHYMRPTTTKDMHRAGYIAVGGGCWLAARYARSLQSDCRAIDEILAHQQMQSSSSWEDDKAYQGISDPAMRPYLAKALLGIADGKKKLGVTRLHQRYLGDVLVHHEQVAKVRETVEHSAPFSERGTLRFENIDPRKFVSLLHRLEIAQRAVPKVPYQTIYRGSHRRGRVTAVHPEYASGKEQLPPLPGKMVIHGMTGVYGNQEALSRLVKLQQAGGLKAITERRRMGIKVISLSPRGDIASGIDTGVSAKIGDDPEYGSHIIFAMNPAILERRDIWFSDCDFGAGSSRYDKYTAYAHKIGQGKIYLPPPHAARSEHLKHGVDGFDNEVYFKHEINLDEVEVLFVSRVGGLDSKVQVLVDIWKKQAAPGGHLGVIPFGGSAKSSLAEQDSTIAAALKAYLKQSSTI